MAGYDVLLDRHCKPWLLEVNHSPSFSIGSAVDAAVKEAVLLDTLRLVRRVQMYYTEGSQYKWTGAMLMVCAITCGSQVVRGKTARSGCAKKTLVSPCSCRCSRSAQQQMRLAVQGRPQTPGHWAASSQCSHPRRLHGRRHTSGC